MSSMRRRETLDEILEVVSRLTKGLNLDVFSIK